MSEKERAKITMGLIDQIMPPDVREAYSLIQEIRERIKPMTDEGTSMDTGGGFGSADLWFTVQGVEYSMSVGRVAKPKDPTP
jgi:hypothetical protein